MIRLIVLALLISSTFVMAQTTQPSWQKTPEGELILRPFATAPYPHKSRENGFKGSKTTFGPEHYQDSTVGIFIPNGFENSDGGNIDYIVHFHGHMNHVSNVITKYKLPQQMAAAKVKAILIVPQGPKDAADSGGGKLELERGAFQDFIRDVGHFLYAEGKVKHKEPSVGRIVLSTHSGGYKVTAAILDHGGLVPHISDVLLLDSSYGSLPWFADWCKADPNHRLVSLYTDHLADENKELMGLLDEDGVKYRQLDEATLKDEELKPRGPVFIHTKGPHDQVGLDYFQRLVETVGLEEVPLTKSH